MPQPLKKEPTSRSSIKNWNTKKIPFNFFDSACIFGYKQLCDMRFLVNSGNLFKIFTFQKTSRWQPLTIENIKLLQNKKKRIWYDLLHEIICSKSSYNTAVTNNMILFLIGILASRLKLCNFQMNETKNSIVLNKLKGH